MVREVIEDVGVERKDICLLRERDISVLKRLSHLPVIIDPSHSTGSAKLVEPLSMGATAMGADGLIIEVHNNPPCALCDGAQSQTPEMFADTMKKIAAIRPHAWKRG